MTFRRVIFPGDPRWVTTDPGLVMDSGGAVYDAGYRARASGNPRVPPGARLPGAWVIPFDHQYLNAQAQNGPGRWVLSLAGRNTTPAFLASLVSGGLAGYHGENTVQPGDAVAFKPRYVPPPPKVTPGAPDPLTPATLGEFQKKYAQIQGGLGEGNPTMTFADVATGAVFKFNWANGFLWLARFSPADLAAGRGDVWRGYDGRLLRDATRTGSSWDASTPPNPATSYYAQFPLMISEAAAWGNAITPPGAPPAVAPVIPTPAQVVAAQGASALAAARATPAAQPLLTPAQLAAQRALAARASFLASRGFNPGAL